MKLGELVSKIPGALCPESLKNIRIDKVTANFTNVEKSTLCVFLSKRKSESEILDAARRGGVILCEKNVAPVGIPCVLCECVRSAYSFACAALYGGNFKKMKIVAVTGTNGKTSVTSLVSYLLNSQNIKTGLVGTLGIYSGGILVPEEKLKGDNLAMTTPDPERLFSALSFMADGGCSVAVIEASSHALELSKLDALRIDVAVFTNLSEDHLDFHGSMEKYYSAKKKIGLISDVILTNVENEWSSKMVNEFGAYAISAQGLVNGAFAHASDINRDGVFKTTFEAYIGDGRYHIETSAFAEYSVFNILAALSSAYFIGADLTLAVKSVSEFEGVDGRCNVMKLSNGAPTVIIDYAHTPDAVEKTLKSVRRVMGDGKLIAIFGCGGDREKEKRSLMGKAASDFADFSFLTEDNSRNEETSDIICEIAKGFDMQNYVAEPSRKRAIEKALLSAGPNDVIVLLGKGHEKYITDKNGRRPFNDREEVEKAYFALYNGRK